MARNIPNTVCVHPPTAFPIQFSADRRQEA